MQNVPTTKSVLGIAHDLIQGRPIMPPISNAAPVMNMGDTLAQKVTLTASVLQMITAPIAQSILVGIRKVDAAAFDIIVSHGRN